MKIYFAFYFPEHFSKQKHETFLFASQHKSTKTLEKNGQNFKFFEP